MTDPNLRAATNDESDAYLAGHQTFPGSVETEHGLLVPDTPYTLDQVIDEATSMGLLDDEPEPHERNPS